MPLALMLQLAGIEINDIKISLRNFKTHIKVLNPPEVKCLDTSPPQASVFSTSLLFYTLQIHIEGIRYM